MAKRVIVGLALTVSLLCIYSNSFGLAVRYTDKANWLAAVNNVTTDDYESYVWAGATSTVLTDPVTLGGIDYETVGDYQLRGRSADFVGDAAYLTDNYLYLNWKSVDVDLNRSVTAIAFDYGHDIGTSDLQLTVELPDGQVLWAPPGAANDYSFLGIISDTAFSTLRIDPNATNALIDNFSYGHNTAVPEPATMILFGTGLAGLMGAARRRKK